MCQTYILAPPYSFEMLIVAGRYKFYAHIRKRKNRLVAGSKAK